MRASTEFWTSGVGLPRSTVKQAKRAEDEGWDGIGLVDSQNLAGDPYVELALAAHATQRIQLGTAVTNPLTRHPAAMATAIATVQAESDGRAVLGIGRGDSALAHLGLAPAPVPSFERYLARLQGYLRGEDVPFAVELDGGGDFKPADALHLAGGPKASRLRWLRDGFTKVPVDVAATGPKVIAAAARHADRITFAVGADIERLTWAMDVARTAAAEAGRSPTEISFGAYVPVYPHPDRAQARQLISGGVASFARFSVMHGSVAGPVTAGERESLEAVHANYDMGSHFTHGSPQSRFLTDEVIDRFGIAGPSGYCIDRLSELIELGLEKVFVMGGGFRGDPTEAEASRTRLATEVLPGLR
ncbi:MAG: LLM class flavin-dependent oxidoreductase [Actinomycetota bacterium]|nr:LLM class flavin-dependent oxidoreductase [Actinomycetota bacterium]